MGKIRDFKFNTSYFDNMNETTLIFAKSILDKGLIKDVYLEEESNIVVLEHLIKPGCKWNDVFDDLKKGYLTEIYSFRIPINLTLAKKEGCMDKVKFNCTYFGCPILIAGFLFHNKFNLKNNIYNDLFNEKKDESKRKILSDEEKIKGFLNSDFKNNYKEILESLETDNLLPKDIKNNFIRKIRIIDNYKKTKTEKTKFKY